MNPHHTYTVRQIHMGRLSKDADLLSSIKKFLIAHEIKAGTISAIGALQHVTLAYFNQQSQEYEEHFFDEGVEILSLVGNVSLKEDEVFAHVHVSLGRSDSSMIGGHLMPNSKIFACEVTVTEYDGNPFERHWDEATGLYLWQ